MIAVLLLEANHVVLMDRLIDAVWGEHPPATARGQIQICISALRRALRTVGISDVIHTRPAGYLFRTGERELDLDEFGRLAAAGKVAAAEGRLSDAADAFGEALVIWDGDALAEFRGSLLQSAAAGLEERRLAVMEQRVEVLLSLGMHHEIIGELMVLTAAHPLRETIRGQLMTALHRDGRQAEALEVYQQGRRAFIDELGLEPGAALQDLQRAILAGDDELLLPQTSGAAGQMVASRQPHMLPADITDFVGRDEEAERIRRVLLRDGPRPNIVVVTGSGGVGKTTLAVHVAHDLSGSFPDGQLYAPLRGDEQRPAQPADILERLLRVLGVPGPAIPEGTDERAGLYRDMLAGRRMLVVLDDAATEEQVLPLLPGHGDAAVIVTSRVRLSGVSGNHVDVGLLSDINAITLLEHVVGRERVTANPAASKALVELCGGLPLALRIAAGRLAARPHRTVAHLAARLSNEQRRLDELEHHHVGIRASIARTYDRLDDDAQRLFRYLGIIDSPDFGGWVVMSLLDTEEEHAEELLDQLVDSRLLDVERAGAEMPRYRFHSLIRIYAREQLAAHEPEPDRSAALRRMFGAWLHLAREAHNREYGGDYTVLHSSAQLWRLPSCVVEAELSDPLTWYEAERGALVEAVWQAANGGFHDICWDLAMSAVALFEARSYLDDWRETHEVALLTCRREGNRRGEAAMLYSLGSLALSEGAFDAAAASLQQALRTFEELGDSHGVGLTERNLARIDRVHGDFDRALSRYKCALTALQGVGDAIGQAHVLCNVAVVKMDTELYGAAEELLTQATEIAHRARCRRVEAQARNQLGQAMLAQGNLHGASQAFHWVVSATRCMGDLVGEAYALYGLGTVMYESGDHSQADLLLGQAQRMATDIREQFLLARILLARGQNYLATGQFSDGARHLSDAEERFNRLNAKPWSARVERILKECLASANRPTGE